MGDFVPNPSMPATGHDSMPAVHESPPKRTKTMMEVSPHRPFRTSVDPEPAFGWLTAVPPTLRERLKWRKSQSWPLPDGPLIVLLFAGRDDPHSLDSCLHVTHPELSASVVALDICRPGCSVSHDFLLDELPSYVAARQQSSAQAPWLALMSLIKFAQSMMVHGAHRMPTYSGTPLNVPQLQPSLTVSKPCTGC